MTPKICVMKLTISLKSRLRAALFLLIVIIPASLFAAETIRIALAKTWGDSLDVNAIRQAIALDPADARFHYTLGILYLPGSGTTDSEGAVREMREALRLSPMSAVYWSGLGRACYAGGDQSCADQAFERTTELAPSKPRFAWEDAVNAVLGNRRSVAVSKVRRYLDLTARDMTTGRPFDSAQGKLQTGSVGTEADEAFELLLRGFNDPELIWRDLLGGQESQQQATSHKLQAGMGRSTALKLAYLNFLCGQERFDLAANYWTELAASQSLIPFAAAKPYLEQVLSSGYYKEAGEVWRYLVNTGAVTKPPELEPVDGRESAAADGSPSAKSRVERGISEPVDGRESAVADGSPAERDKTPIPLGGRETPNLIFNGSFEQEPLQAGFDWHYRQQPYLEMNFAAQTAHSGARALRLDFTLPRNLEYEPVYQLVPVAPGQAYRLSAYTRSEAITSDSGPRLRVTDPQCATCLDVATDAATRTAAWHEVSAQFTTGPHTDIVRVSIWRARSRSFPMEISGRAWFDDISLHPVQ
jgi:hypothetical protein